MICLVSFLFLVRVRSGRDGSFGRFIDSCCFFFLVISFSREEQRKEVIGFHFILHHLFSIELSPFAALFPDLLLVLHKGKRNKLLFH